MELMAVVRLHDALLDYERAEQIVQLGDQILSVNASRSFALTVHTLHHRRLGHVDRLILH